MLDKLVKHNMIIIITRTVQCIIIIQSAGHTVFTCARRGNITLDKLVEVTGSDDSTDDPLGVENAFWEKRKL